MLGVVSAPVDNKFLIQTDKGGMRFRYDLIEWRILKDLGLTFQQAGEKCGFPSITIKRAATGYNITTGTLLQIARGLKLKPQYLLKEGRFPFRQAVERAVG